MTANTNILLVINWTLWNASSGFNQCILCKIILRNAKQPRATDSQIVLARHVSVNSSCFSDSSLKYIACWETPRSAATLRISANTCSAWFWLPSSCWVSFSALSFIVWMVERASVSNRWKSTDLLTPYDIYGHCCPGKIDYISLSVWYYNKYFSLYLLAIWKTFTDSCLIWLTVSVYLSVSIRTWLKIQFDLYTFLGFMFVSFYKKLCYFSCLINIIHFIHLRSN